MYNKKILSEMNFFSNIFSAFVVIDIFNTTPNQLLLPISKWIIYLNEISSVNPKSSNPWAR